MDAPRTPIMVETRAPLVFLGCIVGWGAVFGTLIGWLAEWIGNAIVALDRFAFTSREAHGLAIVLAIFATILGGAYGLWCLTGVGFHRWSDRP